MTHSTSLRSLAALAAAGCISALAGCAAVGPDYVPPDPSAPASWHGKLQDGLRSDSPGPEILARWWSTLNDPILSDLMERAVSGGLDLKSALAKVREARARRGLSQASLFPTLKTSASVTKSGAGSTIGGGEKETYQTGFDAGWEIDVFGGTRRAVEAADASLEASQANLDDALVSLTAEVALNYVEVRAYQTRLAVASANLAAQEESLKLTRSRFEAGLSDELAVQQALYNLESTRSQVPTLRTGLEQAKNRLAVLLGETPGAVHAMLRENRPVPVTPVTVAVGIPAEMLRRRPDIRYAERNLAARTAEIGEAVADLYPKFKLAGSIGLQASSTGDILDTGSRVWSIGPSISWNVFDAGAIRRTIDIREALQEQALIQYESTILSALEEVENALTAYAEEQARRESLAKGAAAALQAMNLAQDQYRAGLVDFSNVLDAQRSRLSFEDQLAQSDAAVTSNLVRLYKALGGGWESLRLDEGNGTARP